MKKRIKKAFTLVELLVVIAILAVLSTVAVVGYNSFTEKANISADQQAVTQMNKLLTALDVTEDFDNISDVIQALDKEELDLQDYKPLTKNTYFYWEKNSNMIIHVDENNNVIYPKDVELSAESQLMSLSGMVPMSDDYTIAEDGSVTIDNGAELVHLMNAVSNNKETVKTISLSGNVDLKGAAVNFGTVNNDISVIGTDGTTLTGLRVDDCSYTQDGGEFAGVSYGYALFGVIKEGMTVEVKNVTISNLVIGNTLTTHDEGANTTGLIAGRVEKGSTLKLENVTIENCTLNGYQKVGTIVGYNANGTVELKNVDVKNTKVNGYLETAKVVGYCNGTLTVDENCDFSGVTVNSTVATERQIGPSNFVVYDKDGNITSLSGRSDNIFLVGPYGNVQYLWASATNDWAWYIIPGAKTERPTVTVPGYESVVLNGATVSASSNFVNGVPVNN